MTAPQAYRGEQLGLPAQGPASLATTGARLGAFVVDAIASALVAALFVPHSGHSGNSFVDRLPGAWSVIPLVVDYVVGTLIAGRTLGMYLFGLCIVRTDPTTRVDLLRILLRTALLCLLIPALVFDRDGRGLHDRLSDTAVVRA